MAENQTAQQAVQNETDDNALATRIAHKADNLKYYLVGAFVVLAAAVGIALYTNSSRAKQQAAAADNAYRSVFDLQAKTPEEAAAGFAAVATEYAGQPAGMMPAVYAFGAAMEQGKYAEAETIARDFLKNYPDNPLNPRFTVAVAQAQLRQGNAQAAIDSLRAFVPAATPETLPEAKLALAQALEQFAEEAKDNPEEYRRRLEAAEIEYTDITSSARLATPGARGFWPQIVTLTADFALVQIKDRLAGHELPEPVAAAPAVDAPATPAEIEAVQSLRPPGAPAEAPIEEAAEAPVAEEPVVRTAVEEPTPETSVVIEPVAEEAPAEEESFGPADRLLETAE
jgi:predicted negative regulator of RcsB-dependent stress response